MSVEPVSLERAKRDFPFLFITTQEFRSEDSIYCSPIINEEEGQKTSISWFFNYEREDLVLNVITPFFSGSGERWMYVVFERNVYIVSPDDESLDDFYPDWLILKTQNSEGGIVVDVYGCLNFLDTSAM